MAKNVRMQLPPGTASYVTLLEPKANDKGELKYSMTLLIPKVRANELEPLKKAIEQVATEKWGPKSKNILAMVKHPLIKDGDKMLDEETGKPKQGYAGCFAISMRTDRKPQILDAAKNEVFTDQDIYSGCLVRVSGAVFAYDRPDNKGVSFGLNNVQVLRKGPRLDGRVAAADEFEEWQDPEEQKATGTDGDLA